MVQGITGSLIMEEETGIRKRDVIKVVMADKSTLKNRTFEIFR
jgi:RNA-binding protein YhbY